MDILDDDFREPTENERSARRVLALAVAFVNARVPLSQRTIQREFYPDMTDKTFRKSFLRDRERLAVAGLSLINGPADGRTVTWMVDAESSFVKENLLNEEDALTLDFLLLPLASDPSFPYARDLRLALAKIDRSFDGGSMATIPPEARRRNSNITRLEDCMTARHTARITYTRADGSQSIRTVAPLGFFFLNNHTYMVALRTDTQETESPHTYNLDRVAKVTENSRSTFTPPADFDVRDFILLPFQMGEPLYEATFELASGEIVREKVCSQSMAVTWAIATGAAPLEPLELRNALIHMLSCVNTWCNTKVLSVNTASNDIPEQPSYAKSRYSGRKNNSERIRELVALLGSLSKAGDVVTIDAISTRLGINTDEAHAMMDIVCQASGEDFGGLLISSNDEETEFTLQYPGTTGRPIRLTPAETIALVHALDVAGIDENDPLRAKLNDAFSSPAVDEEQVRAALGSVGNDGGPLFLCAQSQVENAAIEFMYRGLKDTTPRRRRALVRTLRTEDGHWYAGAYDLDIEQERTFRVDRMSDVEIKEPLHTTPVRADNTERRVGITMTDLMYYRAFDWPTLRVVRITNNALQGSIAYYDERSTWLLRRIIAGNGSVMVDDPTIMQQAAHYANERLRELTAL